MGLHVRYPDSQTCGECPLFPEDRRHVCPDVSWLLHADYPECTPRYHWRKAEEALQLSTQLSGSLVESLEAQQ
jgi:hypothetical protein